MASTGITQREELAFRRGVVNGKEMTAQEREAMMKPFLPPAPVKTTSPDRSTLKSPKSPKLTQRTTAQPKPKPTPCLLYTSDLPTKRIV